MSRLEKEERGVQKLHRPEDEGKLERRGAKLSGRTTWFRKSKAEDPEVEGKKTTELKEEPLQHKSKTELDADPL